MFFFFKQKTAYDMRISDWSSDVCSSDLRDAGAVARCHRPAQRDRRRPGRLGPSPKMGTGADRQALAAARLISWLAYSDGSSRRRSQHQECQMVLRQEGREEGLRAFLRCSRRRQGLPRTRTNWARGKTCLTFLAVAGRRCACIPQGDCRARRPLSRSTGKYREPDAYRALTSRSEARRVGKAYVSKVRFRMSSYHLNKSI